jgi:hypothetical protein
MRFGGTVLKGYGVSQLREGVERLFRRHTGELSGINWLEVRATDTASQEFWERSQLHRAVFAFELPEEEQERTPPTSLEEYERTRYGITDNRTERWLRQELRFLSRPR